MRRFRCPACGGEVYFENTLCLACACPLFFDTATAGMTGAEGRTPCTNRSVIGCNWVAAPGVAFCASCAMNDIVPDLSVPLNIQRWQKIERAKRRLVYSLLRFGLPLATDRGRALRFRFMASVPKPDGTEDKVLTGHDNGIITLSIAEADDALREATRVEMGEPYRTLLGHFRHESGHFYWDVLVGDGGRADQVRAVFGDDRQDYEAALKRHYADGPPLDWQQRYVSAYATAHPWEDFAETWAHMLHIVDGVETAAAYRLGDAADGAAYRRGAGQDVLQSWLPVSLAMNAMTRSMGHPDFYPFQTPAAVTGKLQLLLDIVHDTADCAP